MSKGDFYTMGYYAGMAPEPRFLKVLEIAAKLTGESLLDIGCGDGAFTVLLKGVLKAKDATGIEIAPEAVAALDKKDIKGYQLDIDEEPLPFPDASFDIVYGGEIIEHLFNTDHLLEEVRRVLKQEGTAIFTTPNMAGWASRLALVLGYQPFPTAVSPQHEGAGKLLAKGAEGQWGHIRVFTTRALIELLKIHRYKIVGLTGCPVSLKTAGSKSLISLSQLIDRVMAKSPGLASRIIVVVKKA